MDNMQTGRKSCDFCYRRKIKCDAQKPRCVQCVTHMVDCTYTAPSRKPNPKQRRGHAGISGDGIRSSEERFEHLEALLEQLNERLSVSEQRTEVQTQAQAPRPFTRLTLPTISTIEDGHADYTGSSQKFTSLPPLQQVLPIVQIFLDKFNSVLPLFHAQTLLRLVHEFYSLSPQQRDPLAWAAINVVLALAHRHAIVGDSDPSHSVEYLSRAQSALSSVILGDTQLLNIQVLVGMVMLLQGAQDLQPPLILIATTMRLAHKIGLHTRASLMHLDPVLAQQRVCVFWIAYILDKDISMRSMQPSIQLDDDIDLDLPFHNGDEYQSDDASISAGLVATADGAVQMQYFLTRIQLAVIEGGVYDYLFSTRSGKRSPDERARALDSVARALEQWKASIPREFSPTAAILEAPLDSLCFLGILHSTSLLCTTLVNHAHAWNPEWMGSLRRSAKDGTPPLLPPMWESVVDEARSLLALFEALPVTDRSNFWPQHGYTVLDTQLVDAGMRTLDKMVEETGSEALKQFRDTCIELNQEAQLRRDAATMTVKNRNFAMHFLYLHGGASQCVAKLGNGAN